MKLALLSCLGSALVAAYNQPMWCVPDSCKVDSNCVDSIHSAGGRCCGGKCVRSVSNRPRLIGERCAPQDIPHADNYEQCFAECSQGAFCNTVDETCHAQRGVGCPCLANRECLSDVCRQSRVCGGENLVYGEVCEQNNECKSGLCVDNKCSAIAKGESCTTSRACVPDTICRLNASFQTYCLSPCANGEAYCCYSGNPACAETPANLMCDYSNYTCYAPPPVVLPGLGEACINQCSNSTTMVCALVCNSTECGSQQFCQLRNQLEIGLPCDGDVYVGQCVVGAYCRYFLGNYTCTAFPSDAPTGSPTPRALNSVALGEPCFSEMGYDLCKQPGNMCELNRSYTYVCKQSGTTPVGAFCSISELSIEVRALDECVKGSRCTTNGSAYTCTTPIPVGQPDRKSVV